MNERDRLFWLGIGALIDGYIAEDIPPPPPPPPPPPEEPEEPPPPPPPPPPVESPTGRRPLSWWTEADQRRLNRAWAESLDPENLSAPAVWFRALRAEARKAVADTYPLTALPAAICYQASGETEWLEHAWRKIDPILDAPFNDRNSTREHGTERVLIFDLLYPGLSDERKAAYHAALDRMLAYVMSPANVNLGDSDQTVGVTMAALVYGHLFGATHPPAQAVLDDPRLGGLIATGRDRTTWRNCILDYVMMADGGEWIESGHYNLGTVVLLMMGVTALRRITGDSTLFPEVAAWEPSAAKRYRLMMTPDFIDSCQWGDDEHPRVVLENKWATSAMLFDDPHARQFVYELVERFGTATTMPLPRALLYWDPYGPQETDTSLVFDARGQGILTARTSDDDSASMLCAQFTPTWAVGPVQHVGQYFGHVDLWRNGRWALTHPIAYGIGYLDGRLHNVMLHRGIGSAVEFRTVQDVRVESGYVLMSGTTGGTLLARGAYQPPAPFIHEYSRAIVHLHRPTHDVVVVYDRSFCLDPLAPPLNSRFSVYANTDEAKMSSHPLRQWRWHARSEPTLNGQTAIWDIGSGEIAKVEWLRPLVATKTDQRVAMATWTQLREGERNWHIDLTIADDVPGLQTNITVLQFGPAASLDSVSDEGPGRVRVGPTTLQFNASEGTLLPAGHYNPATPAHLEAIQMGVEVS